MDRIVSEITNLVKEIGMTSRHLTLIILGAILVGLSYGTVPDWVWIPLVACCVLVILLSIFWKSEGKDR